MSAAATLAALQAARFQGMHFDASDSATWLYSCAAFPRVTVMDVTPKGKGVGKIEGGRKVYVDNVEVDSWAHVAEVLNGKRALGGCGRCRVTNIMGNTAGRCPDAQCPPITPLHKWPAAAATVRAA